MHKNGHANGKTQNSRLNGEPSVESIVPELPELETEQFPEFEKKETLWLRAARQMFAKVFGDQNEPITVIIKNTSGDKLTFCAAIPTTGSVYHLRPKAQRILAALTRFPQTAKKIAADCCVPLDTDFYNQLRGLLAAEPPAAVRTPSGYRLP